MINEQTETQMTFETALNEFVTGAQNIANGHRDKHYPNVARKVLEIDNGGQKFARIVVTEEGDSTYRSAHCFVAKTDGYNKKLGAWSQGDVFKCDGWKSPAKGRRGNIFDQTNGLGRMGPYGPEYNK